jgi:hypothetical protein
LHIAFVSPSRPDIVAGGKMFNQRIYINHIKDFSARMEESWAKWRKVEPVGFRLELLELGCGLAPDHSERHPLILRLKTRFVRFNFVL